MGPERQRRTSRQTAATATSTSIRAARRAGQVEIARELADPGVLTIAINARYTQTFRHDGLAERLSLGTELLALPAKPVTTEALAHLMIM